MDFHGKPFKVHPWRKLISRDVPAASKTIATEKAKDLIPSPDLSKKSHDTDADRGDVVSAGRQTPGPKSQTVRRLNEARLELEECIRNFDAPRNQDTTLDTKTKPPKEVVKTTVDPKPDQSLTKDSISSSNEDKFYVDALLELENLDFSTK